MTYIYLGKKNKDTNFLLRKKCEQEAVWFLACSQRQGGSGRIDNDVNMNSQRMTVTQNTEDDFAGIFKIQSEFIILQKVKGPDF